MSITASPPRGHRELPSPRTNTQNFALSFEAFSMLRPAISAIFEALFQAFLDSCALILPSSGTAPHCHLHAVRATHGTAPHSQLFLSWPTHLVFLPHPPNNLFPHHHHSSHHVVLAIRLPKPRLAHHPHRRPSPVLSPPRLTPQIGARLPPRNQPPHRLAARATPLAPPLAHSRPHHSGAPAYLPDPAPLDPLFHPRYPPQRLHPPDLRDSPLGESWSGPNPAASPRAAVLHPYCTCSQPRRSALGVQRQRGRGFVVRGEGYD